MTAVVEPSLRLPRRASYADVEPLFDRLNPSRELVIDLFQFRETELSIESGLLALVLRAKRIDNRISVRLGLGLPSFDENPDFPLWKLFLRSASGLVLAQMADAILDGDGRDVLARIQGQQRMHLLEGQGLMGSGKEVTAPIVDRLGGPKVASALSGTYVSGLDQLLGDMCTRLNLEPERRPSFLQLCIFAQHLLENTFDHAATDLKGHPLDGVRFITVRRTNLADVPPERLAADRPGPEAEYVRGLAEYMAGSELGRGHLIEMTIADSGVGIPARMSGSEAVYQGSLDDERNHLFAALTPGGTSKPALATGSGYGLNRAIEAVASLKGLLVLRTGRFRATFDGLGHSGFDRMSTFVPSEYFTAIPAPYAPGTSFSILIPWRWMQVQRDLFGGTLDAYRTR